MMMIALDFDGTYTEDPLLWSAFVASARARGHEVIAVTMRHTSEGYDVVQALGAKVDGIVFTGRKAKRPFMEALGHKVQIWIDDMPNFILNGSQ